MGDAGDKDNPSHVNPRPQLKNARNIVPIVSVCYELDGMLYNFSRD